MTSCVLKDAGGRRCRQGETFCHHDAPGQIHHCSRPGQDTDAAETRLHSTQPLPVVHPVGWPAASNCPIQSLSPQLDLYRLQLSCRGACREHLVALQPVCILTRAPCSLPSVHGSACCVPLERPSLREQWTSTGTLQCSTTPCLPQSCRPMIGAGYMATWLPWQVDAQLPHLLAASKLTQGLNGIAVLEGEVVVVVAKRKVGLPLCPNPAASGSHAVHRMLASCQPHGVLDHMGFRARLRPPTDCPTPRDVKAPWVQCQSRGSAYVHPSLGDSLPHQEQPAGHRQTTLPITTLTASKQASKQAGRQASRTCTHS